jgi:uncharacterized protein YodC (DUF2158 family)
MAEFNVGEVVRLKSGGPQMTVTMVPESSGGSYKCEWFEGATPKEGFFPGAALQTRPSPPRSIARPSQGLREP